MVTNQELLSIDPKDYRTTVLTPEQILHWFDVCYAGWMHDGNPKSPHVKLSRGKCSNAFFDCMRVLCYPNLCEILAQQLARKLKEVGIEKVDWVIGSPYAAITFSHEVAKVFNAIHGFTEKAPTPDNSKNMAWRRMTIPKGANVLQIEELVTTSGTFREVRRAVEVGNSEPVNFLSTVGALIHRPSNLSVDYGDREVVALVEKKVWAVEPEDCPLCAAGSKLLDAKTHWEELTGKA